MLYKTTTHLIKIFNLFATLKIKKKRTDNIIHNRSQGRWENWKYFIIII